MGAFSNLWALFGKASLKLRWERGERISKAKVKSGWERRKRQRILGKEFCELEVGVRWSRVERAAG